MTNRYVTLENFRNYGIIFKNINENDILKTELAEYGYDDTEIAKGKALYDEASQKLDINKTESAEEKMAYEVFDKLFEELKKTYATDRKKVKIIFKDDERTLSALAVKGAASIRITALLNDMDTLYKQLKMKETLLTPLKRLKIDEAHIDTQLDKFAQVEKAYANYIKEKGESQQATKDKDKAFSELEKWVREFYAIAKIALEDKPQLLESVGKLVRG
ncbi:hypothetical protein ACILE9_04080 [Capnocytophaga cynodegmi]|uniref:hypothetical protein n=1 Tax=Capnocytophaga cynodegmi TaxID=28189 RepID=UPI0037D52FCD